MPETGSRFENTRARARAAESAFTRVGKRGKGNAFLSDDRRSFNCDINNARTTEGVVRERADAWSARRCAR